MEGYILSSRRVLFFIATVFLGAARMAEAACQTTVTVPGDFATIQQAVNNAGAGPLAGDYCVSVGAGTYNEQVVIQNTNTAGYRIWITTATGNSVIVDPPASSDAAFVILNPSVTIQGIRIAPTNAISYGVRIASMNAVLNGVILADTGQIDSSKAGVLISSSHCTISGSSFTLSGANGIEIASNFNRIEFSTVTAGGATGANAIYMNVAHSNIFTDSVIESTAGHGIYFENADSNTILRSTLKGKIIGSTTAAAYFYRGSSNTIALSDLAGTAVNTQAAYFNKLAPYNTISSCTLTAVGATVVLTLSAAHHETITHSTITASNGTGISLEAASGVISKWNVLSNLTVLANLNSFALSGWQNTLTKSELTSNAGVVTFYINNAGSNTISQNTITNSGGGLALEMLSSSFNVITQNRISSTLAVVKLDAGANLNTISFSTITSVNAVVALRFNGASSNTISDCYLETANGFSANGTILITANSSFNTIQQSTVVTVSNSAVDINGSRTTLQNNYFNAGGAGVKILTGAKNTLIASSTFKGGSSGIYIQNAFSTTIENSFIQGRDSIEIYQSTNTNIYISSLTNVDSDYVGLRIGAGNVGVVFSSNSIGSAGGGIYLDADNRGVLNINSVTIQGATTGFYLAAPPAEASLQVNDLTFRNLSAGSTAFYLTGALVSTFTQINFADDSIAANLDGSMLSIGSRILMKESVGAKKGVFYENDPNGYIDWQEPPLAPALSAVILGVSSISWSWSNVADENGFKVIDDNNADKSGNLDPDTLSWIEVQLSTNTQYSRRIAAFNAFGASTSSVLARYTSAVLVSNLYISSVEVSSITLSWQDTANPLPLNYQTQASSDSFSSIISCQTALTQAVLLDLAPNTTYEFRLRVLNGDGVAGDWTAFLTTSTLSDLSPSLPAAPTGAVLGVASITWSWSAVSGAEGYRILDNSGISVSENLGAVFSWTETGLSTNTVYTRKLAAYNAFGASTSTAVFTYTYAAAPSDLSFNAVYVSSLVIAWQTNGNPSGTEYRVQYWKSGGSISVATVSVTSAAIIGLDSQTTYFITVSAFNGSSVAVFSGATVSSATRTPAPANTLVTPGVETTVIAEENSRQTRIDIPPGAFKETVLITVSLNPALPAGSFPSNPMRNTGIGLEINLDKALQPAKEVTISVVYDTATITGFDEDRLILARYEPSADIWVPLISSVDRPNRKVTGRTNHFSTFQIMEVVPSSTVSTIKAFPNPMMPARGHRSMTFSNLPAGASIKIYTLLGELVRDLVSDISGMASWNGKNNWGENAASGVYFVLVEGVGGKKVTKVVIQR